MTTKKTEKKVVKKKTVKNEKEIIAELTKNVEDIVKEKEVGMVYVVIKKRGKYTMRCSYKQFSFDDIMFSATSLINKSLGDIK